MAFARATAVVTIRESKVPEVTLGFWVMKIAATTLGETGGDTVTMTMNWGYLAGGGVGQQTSSAVRLRQ